MLARCPRPWRRRRRPNSHPALASLTLSLALNFFVHFAHASIVRVRQWAGPCLQGGDASKNMKTVQTSLCIANTSSALPPAQQNHDCAGELKPCVGDKHWHGVARPTQTSNALVEKKEEAGGAKAASYFMGNKGPLGAAGTARKHDVLYRQGGETERQTTGNRQLVCE